MNTTLAILTPTYNRSKTLDRLYNSLLKQTICDFVWYIVDDGSTDDTEQKVNIFYNDKFKIEYIKKENGGKHTALNLGINHINEELTIIVDSDDYLTCDAVETIVSDWNTYKMKDNVCGLCYYKKYNNDSVVGQKYDTNIIIDTYVNVRVNQGIKGDKAEVYLTDTLRKHPFPVFKGEKFLSEAIVWNAISKDGLKLVFLGKAIYVCEYLEGGLTQLGRKYRLQNPLGTMEHAKAHLQKDVRYNIKMKYMLLYTATRYFANKSVVEALLLLDCYQILYFIMLVPGKILSIIWNRKYFK